MIERVSRTPAKEQHGIMDNLCPKVVWHDPMNLPNTYQEKTPLVNRRSETVKGAERAGPEIRVSRENALRGIGIPPNLHVALQYVVKCGGMFKDPKPRQKSTWLPPSEGCLGGYRVVLGSPGGELPHFGEGTAWNHGTTCAPKWFGMIL